MFQRPTFLTSATSPSPLPFSNDRADNIIINNNNKTPGPALSSQGLKKKLKNSNLATSQEYEHPWCKRQTFYWSEPSAKPNSLVPLTCQLGWLFGITPSLRSFPFFFVHLFNFFFQQHHKLSDKLDRLSDGERERGRILSLESPWPEQRSDNLIDNTCPDKRCVQGLLLPFKCFASSRSNKNQVMCEAPSSGRLEGCTMLPLRSRWKSWFILHEKERRKAKCKNLYCNSK